MAFWCKGKKEYCNEEECNSCKFENGSGGIEFEDDVIDGIIISQWISVKDRLPVHVCTPCLIYADGCTSVADWSHDKYGDDWWFYVDGEYDPEVTHWMPLPVAPKEDGKDV